MRILATVIDEILGVIPPSETLLRGALAAARASSLYSPPEMAVANWRALAELLSSLSSADAPWTAEAARIFSGGSPTVH